MKIKLAFQLLHVVGESGSGAEITENKQTVFEIDNVITASDAVGTVVACFIRDEVRKMKGE